MDEIARGEQRKCWVEKTPLHLYQVEGVKEAVPDARFVHLIRSGPEVVASLYDVSHQYPHLWPFHQSIQACVSEWNQAICESERFVGAADHLFMRYENLIENLAYCTAQLFGFAGLTEEADALLRRATAGQELFDHEREPWKASVTGEVLRGRPSKFERLFSLAEQQAIQEKLVDPSGLTGASH